MDSHTTKKTYSSRSAVGWYLLLALTSSTIHDSANAWVATPTTFTAQPSTSYRASAVFMSTDKGTENEDEDEGEIARLEQELKIAKLEAELAKLKEEKADAQTKDAELSATVADTSPPPKKPLVVVEEKPPTKLVQEDDEEMISLEDASMDMFLSEGWKEARSGYDPKKTATMTRKTEEQNSAFGLIAKVVAGLVAGVVFSQIPVGQEDLSKYSAIKSSAPKVSIDLGDINRVKGQKINYNDEDDS